MPKPSVRDSPRRNQKKKEPEPESESEESRSESESSEESVEKPRKQEKHKKQEKPKKQDKGKDADAKRKFEEALSKLEQEDDEPEEEAELPEGVTDTSVTGKKGKATSEEILASFEEILESIAHRVKDGSESKSSIAFLKNLHKQIKTLRAQTKPLMKKPRKTGGNAGGTNTGISKPIKVSKEMCKFAGWDEDELHSRVDVTRFICDYIKKNNLQNPDNKKQIVPDNKLAKLLGHSKSDPPLTYFNLQTHLKKQNHFPKE
jgi:upstream activation factor subunit UAF30